MGGIGHFWVKRLFIDRDYKTGQENPEENENPDDYSFIFATVEDNDALMKSSPDYLQMLSSLPERLRKAHRYGDWDALAGSYFEEFREEYHTCAPFSIPESWPRYRAFDYGLDMFACFWIAVDRDGRSYVYRELCKSNLIAQDAAQAVLDNTLPDEHISITFAPPDIWARQKDSGKSSAEIFMTKGVGLVKASNNRVQGHLQIKEMFAPRFDGRPGVIIFNSCRQLIKDLRAIQADETNPNDCAKQPHELTHTVDALRYYCISRILAAEDAQAQEDGDEDEKLEDYDEAMTGGSADMSYLAY